MKTWSRAYITKRYNLTTAELKTAVSLYQRDYMSINEAGRTAVRMRQTQTKGY